MKRNRSNSPVTCRRCGTRWPRDPALEVECPSPGCGARVGAWCKRPSGHRAMDIHRDRELLAMARGLLRKCPGSPAETAAREGLTA